MQGYIRMNPVIYLAVLVVYSTDQIGQKRAGFITDMLAFHRVWGFVFYIIKGHGKSLGLFLPYQFQQTSDAGIRITVENLDMVSALHNIHPVNEFCRQKCASIPCLY